MLAARVARRLVSTRSSALTRRVHAQAVVLPLPAGPCANYARVTTSVLTSLSHTAVWVRVPLIAPAVSAVEGTTQEDELLLEVRARRRALVQAPQQPEHCYFRWTRRRARACMTRGSGGTRSECFATASLRWVW